MITHDEFGPEKVVEVYDPKTGMHGFLVIDNTVLGPGKGGIRMTPSVSAEEVYRLARAMTWKNALAGIPFGGAKSGIRIDPKSLSQEKKDEIVISFAKALKPFLPILYIAGPDMNMAEHDMEVFANTAGKSTITGKPVNLGGLPHELGSTGYGVVQATIVAAGFANLDLKTATIAIEGFGNVGEFAAKFLSEIGVKIIAVSDSKGLIVCETGIEFEKLKQTKKEHGTVTKYPGGSIHDSKNIISINADILITAAIPDLISDQDADKVKARLLVQGSNIPMSPVAEEILWKKGIIVVPDFVANAGGVISSYVETINGSVDTMWKMVHEKIVANTREVLERSRKENIMPRDAALIIAKERIRDIQKEDKQ